MTSRETEEFGAELQNTPLSTDIATQEELENLLPIGNVVYLSTWVATEEELPEISSDKMVGYLQGVDLWTYYLSAEFPFDPDLSSSEKTISKNAVFALASRYEDPATHEIGYEWIPIGFDFQDEYEKMQKIEELEARISALEEQRI